MAALSKYHCLVTRAGFAAFIRCTPSHSPVIYTPLRLSDAIQEGPCGLVIADTHLTPAVEVCPGTKHIDRLISGLDSPWSLFLTLQPEKGLGGTIARGKAK